MGHNPTIQTSQETFCSIKLKGYMPMINNTDATNSSKKKKKQNNALL